MESMFDKETTLESVDQNDFIGIDPADISRQEAYRILLHCVSPRPIAFVSTLSAEGIANLAPFSFFMAGGANPPSVAFSPSFNRDGKSKDTLRNIEETGEFVINVVSYSMRDKMNITSIEYPHGVSEWEAAGFTAGPTVKVKAPRVSESLLAMECRLFQIVPHGGHPLSANYVIGEVVYFHVAQSLMEEDSIDQTRVDYIGRMGGEWYTRVSPETMFVLPRPPKP